MGITMHQNGENCSLLEERPAVAFWFKKEVARSSRSEKAVW